MTNPERKGLTGEEIDEDKAKQIAEEFIGKDKIKEINSNGVSENANIPSYDFAVKTGNNNDTNLWISVSRKGGHVVFMNYNRDASVEVITTEKANELGKEFLNTRGISNMKETYYMKQDGIVTVSYTHLTLPTNSLV